MYPLFVCPGSSLVLGLCVDSLNCPRPYAWSWPLISKRHCGVVCFTAALADYAAGFADRLFPPDGRFRALFCITQLGPHFVDRLPPPPSDKRRRCVTLLGDVFCTLFGNTHPAAVRSSQWQPSSVVLVRVRAHVAPHPQTVCGDPDQVGSWRARGVVVTS